jgi:hypothetical protein
MVSANDVGVAPLVVAGTRSLLVEGAYHLAALMHLEAMQVPVVE